jgi:capsular polysaccharide biosynthesis protein
MISFLVKLLKKKILVGKHRTFITQKIKEPFRAWIVSILTRKLGLKINFLTREEIFDKSEKYQVFQFGSKESIIYSEPYQFSDELPHAIAIFSGNTLTLEKPFVLEVANAELVGPMAIGFDEDGRIISETTNGAPPNSALLTKIPIQSLILKKLPNFGTPQVDAAYSLVNPWSQGYFHWIVDCLARLEGVEYYQQQTGRKPLLIIESNPPKWKIESLRLLGYEPDDCIPWNGSRLKVKRLVVPSFRRERAIISASACRWLCQRMLSNLPDGSSEKLSFSLRIYISRTKKTGRNVINEEQVLKALTPFGFVAYTLENMSFPAQVRLFSQAEIVVAPHGAGLTNTIFAPQNLIIIELFGSYSNVGFFVIAKGLGFHYGCLGPVGNKERNQSEKYNGIIADIPKLRALVTAMLDTYSDRQPVEITY